MPSEDTMNLVISLLVAALFTFAGWVAQTPRGDFVITIDAPSHGRTRVECVEGCAALVGRRDIGLHREGGGTPTYGVYCSGPGVERCRAGFHGFLKDDVAGSAPAQRGDFIINVEAPGGETTLECIEGCAALVGARDISTYRGEGRGTTYTFSCGGSRCEATFHGFLKR
jgi:hypothetical protein